MAPERIGLTLCLALALAACGGDAETPPPHVPHQPDIDEKDQSEDDDGPTKRRRSGR